MERPAGDRGFMARIRRLVEWGLSLKPTRAFFLYVEHRGPMLSDSVTYRTLFSVFAGVFLGFSVAGLWLAGNPDAMDALVASVDAAIPGLVGEDGLVAPGDLVQPVSFTIAGIIAAVGLVGTAIGAIGSVRAAFLTIADRIDQPGFFLWRILGDLAIAISFGVLLAAGAVLTTFGTTLAGTLFDWLGIGSRDPFAKLATASLPILVTFVIDAVVVAGLFLTLSGLRPRARDLWSGALLGGFALTVLQVLSGLFVGGASSNPLLASFASLIALLLWLNLSAQVILIAGSYIITGLRESEDRIAERHGARSLALRRVRQAERRAREAGADVQAAREAFEAEEAKAAGKAGGTAAAAAGSGGEPRDG
ncbi:YihY/virulence factor BrkB family protein [Agromyces sp. MMS24-K17]|uniref:YihY/virulence factor BrkB family protein n=1 Tax=Agromyces sp. MMS24-K17 TaxID=3372850 RepID=UPI00375457DD